MTGPTVLVVQPEPTAPLDRFAPWFEQAGVGWEVVHPAAGERVPGAPTLRDGSRAAGLIVLGGSMSSNDDADHPWLKDVRELLRQGARAGRPVLGICLGAQLLAQALGGRVVPGSSGVEAGIVTVEATPAAADDALLAGLGPRFRSVCLHGDAIDELPDGAVLLGSSAQYPHQAFRAAERAWAVQFHPEASPATYRAWAGKDRGDAATNARIAAGVDAVARHAADTEDVSRRLALAFATRLREG